MKKNIFKIVLIFLAILSFGFLEREAQLDSSLSISQEADRLMRKAKLERQFVGASAGIFANGKVQWTGASGDRDKGNISATADMLTRTASISKPMTAIAVLQLYEQGKIDLDVPIQTYFPAFPKKEKGVITVRHLLQQTSGIEPYANKKEAFPFKHYASLEDAIKVFSHRPLAFEPGTQYLYTTYGYVVLGAIIEKISGMPYEEYMQQHIWSIANMPTTSLEKKGQNYPNKSKLYRKFWGMYINTKQTDLSLKYPGGGVQSTAQDLLYFGKAILENKLIEKETLAMMIADPKIRKKEAGNGYGMGWFLYGVHPEYGLIIGHSGGQRGCSAQLFIWLEKETVAVVLGNSGTFGNTFSLTFELGKLGLAL